MTTADLIESDLEVIIQQLQDEYGDTATVRKIVKLLSDAKIALAELPELEISYGEPTREELDDRNVRARDVRGWNV